MEKGVDTAQSMLCMACLCVGRSLHEIRDDKLKQYYLDTLNEIPLCNNPTIAPVICWECEAVLRKVLSFREQVKDSYRILQTYTHENLYECLLSDVSRPPRLKVHINAPVVISPDDNNMQVKEEIKIEFNDVSEIQNNSQNGLEDLNDHIQTSDTKKEKKKSKKQQNSNSNSKEKSRPPRLKYQLNTTCVPVNVTTGATELEIEFVPKDCKELKLEDCLNTEDDTTHLSDGSDPGIEVEIKNVLEVKKKTVRSKMRNAKKIVKRLQSCKKTKPPQTSPNQKILTLDLTYEEMLADRDRESKRDSYTQAPYKCESCLMGFHYNKSYKLHMMTKHSPDIGDYSCPICKTIISSVESFTAHYKRHMRRYECSICRKRTIDVKAMQQHYYTTHEISLKEYKCNLCGQISNSIDTHRYHKDTHKARVQCDECDKTFSHRAGLMNHRLSVHEYQNAFPCTVCDKVFRWKTSLKRHLEKHDIKSKAAAGGAYCAECDIGFSSLCSLQRHLRNSLKHVTHDQLKFICDHCNRRFADKTKLRDHIEEKHLHRTYQCHICQKTSKNRVGLEQHVRNVHKGRPNNKMCHHCGKGFPTKVQLESHIRTHTGERPFICEYCPTTFSQQSNLYKHHRQVHLNIKSKRYPLCNKKKKPDGNRTDDPPQSDCSNEQIMPLITGVYSVYYS
ncbi:uncharacterized protein [Epargyreus clarus]|uniref:uncharacterized protein isoform X3 n=1 Tax=Epargyreus clarus TaxID=520877 RepID=UPI003C2BF630